MLKSINPRKRMTFITSLAQPSLTPSDSSLNPTGNSKIEAVRENLASLEDRPALCPMDNESSMDVYKQLLDELQTLIEQY